MRLIENIVSKTVTPTRSAAMYYKTEPFFTDISSYTHTNNWEIVRAIEILTNKGFSVDLIDRDNQNWVPQKEYDLFLGLGVGNSGKNFSRYARSSKAKVKVLLSMGPQPDVSNELVLERYRSLQNIIAILGEGELSEQEKITVNRAKKLIKFFSQPFYTAEQFTNVPGKYVSLPDTIAGVKTILSGKYDELSDEPFYMIGKIQEAEVKAREQ